MNIKTIIIAAGLLVAPVALAQEASDLSAVEAAVFDYFEGQGTASAERLNRAFACEDTSMVGVRSNDDGIDELTSWKDMCDVLSNWASNETPPGLERTGEILDLNITDGRIATVTFKSADRFYDALTLAKINGEWKIIAKAFVLQ